MPNKLKNNLTNTFTTELPADKETKNGARQVFGACYSFVETEIPAKPQLIQYSKEMVEELGIENPNSEEFLAIVSGAKNIGDFKPFAMCYGGHQFGHWAGQLGDGRTINIGELEVNHKKWALQLKGAGPTPYSRTADGYAVLRSSIREYLCSEAMHHLGVPTTRALSLALTGKQVLRDVMYNGNPAYEKGAVVCRVSPNFIRFGSFEIHTSREDYDNLKQLTDYTIKHFYSHLGEPNKEPYLAFFKEVATKTKDMIVHWQRVGFVHGVMNTDNMSIMGLTIDYGPYGWLENFDPQWTPNTTDSQQKRYRFENQASIALWNLTQLANALYPLINEAKGLEKILGEFKTEYLGGYYGMMMSKLGLQKRDKSIENFIIDLTTNLYRSDIDMTLFFRKLNEFDAENPTNHFNKISEASYHPKHEIEQHQELWNDWLIIYADKIKKDAIGKEIRIAKMNLVNPKYVLRNYMAQLAIEAAEKEDYTLINELEELLKNPYSEQPNSQKWFAKRPDWAKDKIGSSMLSCSS
jgi:uncharacterized protein YdiU (UPF0061 family)